MYFKKCFVGLSQLSNPWSSFLDTKTYNAGDVLKAEDLGLEEIVVYETPCDVMKSCGCWINEYDEDIAPIWQCEANDCFTLDPDLDKKIFAIYSASEIRLTKKLSVKDAIHEQWIYGKSETDNLVNGSCNGESVDLVSKESFDVISAESFWDSRIVMGGRSSYAFVSGTKNMVSTSGDYANVFCIGSVHNVSATGAGSCVYVDGQGNRVVINGDNGTISSKGYQNLITATGDYCWVHSNGENDVICNIGLGGKVRAKKGSYITLATHTSEYPSIVKTAKVDGVEIKEDIWYELIGGEFVANV